MKIARMLLETAGRTLFGTALLVLMLLILIGINGPAAVAQQFMSVFVSGGSGARGATGRPYGVPAYLLPVNINSDTTTNVKNAPGVLACVVVNKGGSGTATATLYNTPTGTAVGNVLGVLDTDTPIEYCYGMIFSGGLAVVTTSGGTAADLTVTYR